MIELVVKKSNTHMLACEMFNGQIGSVTGGNYSGSIVLKIHETLLVSINNIHYWTGELPIFPVEILPNGSEFKIKNNLQVK